VHLSNRRVQVVGKRKPYRFQHDQVLLVFHPGLGTAVVVPGVQTCLTCVSCPQHRRRTFAEFHVAGLSRICGYLRMRLRGSIWTGSGIPWKLDRERDEQIPSFPAKHWRYTTAFQDHFFSLLRSPWHTHVDVTVKRGHPNFSPKQCNMKRNPCVIMDVDALSSKYLRGCDVHSDQ
jgi:hypothetical protein